MAIRERDLSAATTNYSVAPRRENSPRPLPSSLNPNNYNERVFVVPFLSRYNSGEVRRIMSPRPLSKEQVEALMNRDPNQREPWYQ